MGATTSKDQNSPPPHRARFDEREIQYLTESFRDLAGRSGEHAIGPGTFRRAFDLPGLVGERLFAVAAGDHEGVEFPNFVGILAVGLRGDVGEACSLLFAMFDLNGDGVVDEKELRAMLNHFPTRQLTDEDFEADASINRRTHGDVTRLTNEDLVRDALAGAPSLDEAAFGRWLRSSPFVADHVLKALVPPVATLPRRTPRTAARAIAPVAPQESVHRPPPIVLEDEQPTPRSPASQRALAGALAALSTLGDGPPPPPSTIGLLARELRQAPPPPSPPRVVSREASDADAVPRLAAYALARRDSPRPRGRGLDDTGPVRVDAEGWLYKFGSWFGARRRRHYVLAGKCLYQYADARLDRPKGVLFLPGCRVQPLERPRPASHSPSRGQRGDGSHGFVLSLPGEHASLFDEMDDSQCGASSSPRFSDSDTDKPSSWGSAASSYRKRPPGSPSRFLRRASDSANNLRSLLDSSTRGGSPGEDLDASKSGEQVLYAASRSERDAWVTALRKASAQTPVDDAYVLQEKLGTGHFSDVFAAVRRADGKSVAIKRVQTRNAPRSVRDALRVEVAVMRLARHPHVMRLEELHEDGNAVHLVMPRCQGDLKARLAKKDVDCWGEHNARRILRPLCHAVAYLHELGVVHRDLKPENILVGEEVVLCDFGLAAMVRPGQCLTAAVGTPQYVAPEVVQRVPYGAKVDTWALGVVLFLLVGGVLPFDGPDVAQKVVRCDLRSLRGPVWRASSRACRDLVARLLTAPDGRLSAKEMLDHAWTATVPGPAAPVDFVVGEPVDRTAAPGLGLLSVV